jgi:hypothetical protein
MKQALRAKNSTITENDISAVFGEKDIAAMFEGANHAAIGFKI